MKLIKARFSRFRASGTQNPVFLDLEGNEYFWQENDKVNMQVAARFFWDEFGYNEKLKYQITITESNDIRLVEGIHGLN